MQTKPTWVAGVLAISFFSFSSLTIAAGSGDTYTHGFATYAKDNPEWASSIENYLKDLKKVMQEDPSLDDSKAKNGANSE